MAKKAVGSARKATVKDTPVRYNRKTYRVGETFDIRESDIAGIADYIHVEPVKRGEAEETSVPPQTPVPAPETEGVEE